MKYDLIIIGGGIIGKSLAFEMSKYLDNILILDKKAENIASKAAGGMLGVYGELTADKNSENDILEFEFRKKSNALYYNWIQEVSKKTDLNITINKGTYIIGNTSSKDDFNNIDFIEEKLIEDKEDYKIVSESEIPFYKPNNKYRSHKNIYIPNEGFVNNLELLEALEKYCNISDKITFLNDEIIKIDTQNKYVVSESDEIFYYSNLSLCNGIGIKKLNNENHNGLDIPELLQGKGVSIEVECEENLNNVIRTPNRDFACGTHVIPRNDKRVYVGATNRISNTPAVESGISSGEVQSLLHSSLNEINTDIRTSNIEKMSYGIRPISIDQYPIVGVTNDSSISIGTGTYRNGVLMAPLISKILCYEIKNNAKHPDNTFSPKNRNIYLKEGEKEKAVKNGLRDLVSFIQEPDGHLPYNREMELFNFIYSMLDIIIHNDFSKKIYIKETLKHYPISETIPQIFYDFNKN